MTRFYSNSLALLVLGIVLTCLCIAGPARASTTTDAITILCPGRESIAPPHRRGGTALPPAQRHARCRDGQGERM
jgi:hypothetical protein